MSAAQLGTIDSPSLATENARKVFRSFLKGLEPADVFSPLPETQRDSTTSVVQQTSFLPSLEPVAQISSGISDHKFFLPIEAFRSQKDSKQQLLFTPEKTFLSSGTTDLARSLSPFSKDGLALYKYASLLTFKAVIGFYFNNTSNLKGFSLVPPTREWPHSSLAQMIAWIGEEWPVAYLTPETLGSMISHHQQPLFIIGTAFHFVWLIDAQVNISLPPGSIVIETGGYKGKSRELSRQELYDGICQAFGITQDYIISEYGMCELASQAYDWVDSPHCDPENCLPLDQRAFRFPRWVSPYAAQGAGRFKKSGKGALTLDDPLRIDYPWPLRTQDYVNINEKPASLRLLGRLKSAPPKGCSMNAEEQNLIRSAQDHKSVPSCASPFRPLVKTIALNDEALKAKAAGVGQLLQNLLKKQELIDLLNSEWSSSTLGLRAIEDLLVSMPSSAEQWYQTARAALGTTSVESVPQNWLIVLPRSHSVALFYPVVMGYLLGLNLFIRTTQSSDRSSEKFALKSLKSWPLNSLHLLDPVFKVDSPASVQNYDAILGYGSSLTMAALHRRSNLPAVLFGTTLTGVLCYVSELIDNIREIVRDCFSLAQRGCYSARFIILVRDSSQNPGSLPDLATWERLAEESRIFMSLHDNESAPETCALLDSEAVRWSLTERFTPLKRKHPLEPVFALTELQPREGCKDVLSNLGQAAFSVPIFIVNKDQAAQLAGDMLAYTDPLIKLSLSPLSHELMSQQADSTAFSTLHPRACRVGRANTPPWDGLHDGRPLFCPDTSKLFR
jgi:hypothetical protein